MRRRLAAIAVLSCVLAAGGVAAATATAAPAAVPAKTWTNTLCITIGGWASSLQQRTATYQTALDRWKKSGSLNITTIRAVVVDYVHDATVSTQAMVRKVKAGGAPAVAHGATTQRQVTAALDQVTAIFLRAQAQARALPTSAAGFVKQATVISRQIETGFGKVGAAFTAIGASASPAIEKAARTAPACKSLGA